MLLDMRKVRELESALKYSFTNLELLERAFIHPSSEYTDNRNYERLEFLGDEVVGLGISTILFETFPAAGEGDLSKARANLIDEQGLATISRSLNLGSMLILGKGEEKGGGRDKDSIISDIFESLMAVIYIESGWEKVFPIMRNIFTPLIGGNRDIEELLNHINRDYKTRLQELAQNLELDLPVYKIVDREGPEHNITFTVECDAMGFVKRGRGKNKKSAEQSAAHQILQEMRVIQ